MNEYNESSIGVLQGLEGIRKRPTMYIGSLDKVGVYRIVREIIDNSVDEWLAGYNDKVYLFLDRENSTVTVADNGRGIPVGIHAKTKISTLTTVFTHIHSGGKFNDESYSFSGGLNGVGSTATNATSEFFEVWTHRDKEWHYQRFEHGIAVTKVIRKLPDIDWPSGTIIRFKPDATIFSDITIDADKIYSEIEDLSYICPALIFRIYEKGEYKQFYQLGGLKQMIIDTGDELLVKDTILVYRHETSEGHIDLALTWVESETETIWSFVNTSFTSDGGTHTKGLRLAIVHAIQEYDDSLEIIDDITAGMLAAIHIKIKGAEFKSQTKEQLMNVKAEKFVHDQVLKAALKFFSEHPALAETITERAHQLADAREEYRKAKQVMKNIKSTRKHDLGKLPVKLAVAPYCEPEERELYLVEGDSAGGSAKFARDKNFQEVLPLKGKVINAARHYWDKVFDNEEIQNIVQSINASAGEEENIKNARVGKVILLCDADPDGQHISSLIVTFFANYLPNFFKAGRLYLVDAPLFRGMWKGKVAYGHTLEEAQAQFPSNAKVQISRLKGHGEANSSEVEFYAMSVKTRKLIQITYDNLDRINEIMGDDSTFRKQILGI